MTDGGPGSTAGTAGGGPGGGSGTISGGGTGSMTPSVQSGAEESPQADFSVDDWGFSTELMETLGLNAENGQAPL